MTRVLALVAVGGAIAALPAAAQHHSMPGMTMPIPMPAKPEPAKKSARPAAVRKAQPARRPVRPAAAPPKAATMPAMDHAAMPGMTMPEAARPAEEEAMAGTALPAGDAPPPPLPTDHYADRQFGAAAMGPARAQMMREGGAQRLSQVMVNIAEYQVRDGRDGYRWDGEGWFGGDIDRAVIKTEGSGAFRNGVEAAEAQALYSRAIGPYFDLQAGIRHDFAPSPTRTYATVGVEGLAPYMFDTEAAVFLSTRGEVLARLEGWYDQRLTQRLVLQPRIELNLSAQDIPATRIGAGLSDAELGVRLRYEIARTFAPYIGLSYAAKTGRTAKYARADGEDARTTSLVAGVRFWF